MSTTHAQVRWETQPHAAALVAELLADLLNRCPAAARLARQLHDHTGTRLLDWIDHMVIPDDGRIRHTLERLAFAHRGDEDGCAVFDHQHGMFPTLLVAHGDMRRIAVRVESVADYLVTHGLDAAAVLGGPLASVRMAEIAADEGDGGGAALWIVERHGDRGFEPGVIHTDEVRSILHHAERFRRRPRFFADDAEGYTAAHAMIDEAINDVGVDRTADLFFAAEREYWQRRNRAAQVQKARQDSIGMGWANHDHHTYRSSRASFDKLVGVFEKLGLVCRERFYAGAEAGWGAQVMEQPVARIVVFADVDLTPGEVTGDFAHNPLPDTPSLGTVGMWCALHGDSFLQAGMHHLECQFDFTAARSQLESVGIASMKPFTDFEYLKQAFTEGERWPVDPHRVDAALTRGWITAGQAAKFKHDGAIGSHLEVLQRDDGYKGFNQTGINDIIRKTDPRTIGA